MAKKRKEQMQNLYEKAVERFEKIEDERARLRCLERAAMRDMHLQTGGLPPDYSGDEMSYPEKKKKLAAEHRPKPSQKPRNTR